MDGCLLNKCVNFNFCNLNILNILKNKYAFDKNLPYCY